MGKSQKDLCPFSYWSTREANLESTGVVNFIKVRRQKKKKKKGSVKTLHNSSKNDIIKFDTKP